MSKTHDTPSTSESVESTSTSSLSTDETGQDVSGGNAAVQEAVSQEQQPEEETSTLDSAAAEVETGGNASSGPAAVSSLVRAISGTAKAPSGTVPTANSADALTEGGALLEESGAELDQTSTIDTSALGTANAVASEDTKKEAAPAEETKEVESSEEAAPAIDEKYADGFQSEAAISDFTGAIGALSPKWNDLSPDNRETEIANMMTGMFTKLGIQTPSLEFKKFGGHGRFDGSTWGMTIDEGIKTCDSDELIEYAVTFYHESRHAEQLHRIMQYMANEGKTSEELDIPSDVQQHAANAPELGGDTAAMVPEWFEAQFGTGPAREAVKEMQRKAQALVRLQLNKSRAEHNLSITNMDVYNYLANARQNRDNLQNYASQLETQRNHIAPAEAELSTWQQQYNVTQAQIDASAAKLNQLRSGITGLISQVSSLLGIQTEAIAEAERLEQEIAALQADLQATQQQLTNAQIAYETAIAEAGGSPSAQAVSDAEAKFNEAQAAYDDDLAYYNMTVERHERWSAQVKMSQDVIADFNNREAERDAMYAAYMQIPLEKDAYAVGDKVQAALQTSAASGSASA